MIPDYHLHSSYSDDSEADIYDMVKSAQEKGLTSFCITDHYDRDYPAHYPDDFIFDLDTKSYMKDMLKIKKELEPTFDMRIGIELGVMPSTAEGLNSFTSEHPGIDFVIASTHIVDNEDPYYPYFYEGRSEKEAYGRYFETMLLNVSKFDDFSVYGHLDYCVRYGPNKNKYFDINDYKEIFEAAFKIIIPKGKGIEINTGSLYRGLDVPHPHKDILKLYKEMGGEILTFGSDAHSPEHIAYDFSNAALLAKSLGFKYYCTYNKLVPEFHEIP